MAKLLTVIHVKSLVPALQWTLPPIVRYLVPGADDPALTDGDGGSNGGLPRQRHQSTGSEMPLKARHMKMKMKRRPELDPLES